MNSIAEAAAQAKQAEEEQEETDRIDREVAASFRETPLPENKAVEAQIRSQLLIAAHEQALALEGILATLLSETSSARRGELLHDAYMKAGTVLAEQAANGPFATWRDYPLAAAYMVQRYCR